MAQPAQHIPRIEISPPEWQGPRDYQVDCSYKKPSNVSAAADLTDADSGPLVVLSHHGHPRARGHR